MNWKTLLSGNKVEVDRTPIDQSQLTVIDPEMEGVHRLIEVVKNRGYTTVRVNGKLVMNSADEKAKAIVELARLYEKRSTRFEIRQSVGKALGLSDERIKRDYEIILEGKLRSFTSRYDGRWH